MYIDSHCHLSDLRIQEELPQMLSRSEEAHVTSWLQGGIDPCEWSRQIDLHHRFPLILPVFGLHPWWVAQKSAAEVEEGLIKLRQFANAAVAIGETGLDRMPRFKTGEALQEVSFLSHLALAQELRKPVVLHIVRAHDQALKILENHSSRGIVHSFSGGPVEAKRYIDNGFLISFSGSVTKEGFSEVKAAVETVPDSHLLVETDSPDQRLKMMPKIAQKTGGEKTDFNEPRFLISIAEYIGKLRGQETEAILKMSTDNLKRLLNSYVNTTNPK